MLDSYGAIGCTGLLVLSHGRPTNQLQPPSEAVKNIFLHPRNGTSSLYLSVSTPHLLQHRQTLSTHLCPPYILALTAQLPRSLQKHIGIQVTGRNNKVIPRRTVVLL